MELVEFKALLKRYSEKDIIITHHAELQAYTRGIDITEVKEDLVNPKRLVFVKEQDAKNNSKKKYDCYFAYDKHRYNRYILTLNGKVIIVTIIKINRDWQRAIG